MLKAQEEAVKELHEARIEYLQYRAAYHIKKKAECDNWLDKINHIRMFAMYNAMLVKEKYGEDWKL